MQSWALPFNPLLLLEAYEPLNSHVRATHLHVCTQVNAEIMKGFETPLAEEPAAFASRDRHINDEGDDGIGHGDDGIGHGDDVSDNFREFVAEAEAALEAGIALARAERAERDEIRKDSLGVRNLRLFCPIWTFLPFFVSLFLSYIFFISHSDSLVD